MRFTNWLKCIVIGVTGGVVLALLGSYCLDHLAIQFAIPLIIFAFLIICVLVRITLLVIAELQSRWASWQAARQPKKQ